jgi:hypothetical protein
MYKNRAQSDQQKLAKYIFHLSQQLQRTTTRRKEKKKKYQKYQQRLLLLSSLSYHQSWSRPLTPTSAADKLTRVLVKK